MNTNTELLTPIEEIDETKLWVEQIREASQKYFETKEKVRLEQIKQVAIVFKKQATEYALSTGAKRMTISLPDDEVLAILKEQGLTFEIEEGGYIRAGKCEMIWIAEEKKKEEDKKEDEEEEKEENDKKEENKNDEDEDEEEEDEEEEEYDELSGCC